jgi:hypothetical protein
VLECHEGFGVARAHDADPARDRTLLSLLVVPDFAEAADALLVGLAREADVVFLAPQDDWIARVAEELS